MSPEALGSVVESSGEQALAATDAPPHDSSPGAPKSSLPADSDWVGDNLVIACPAVVPLSLRSDALSFQLISNRNNGTWAANFSEISCVSFDLVATNRSVGQPLFNRLLM